MKTLLSNIIKLHRVIEKGFYMFFVNFGVRSDMPLNKQTRLKNKHFVTQSYFIGSVPLGDYKGDS